MKIGVIGSGSVGTAIAKRLIPHGHEVMLSFSRDISLLNSNAQALGASVGSPEQAVAFGDVIVLAVPWLMVPEAIKEAGLLKGKILWDCTNALKLDFSGLEVGTTTSGAEIIQQLAVGARVVKGIPPFAELLHFDRPTVNGAPVCTFICSDDHDAKMTVWPLLAALPSRVIDVGNLDGARYIEPAGFLLVRLAYSQQLGAHIGFDLIHEQHN